MFSKPKQEDLPPQPAPPGSTLRCTSPPESTAAASAETTSSAALASCAASSSGPTGRYSKVLSWPSTAGTLGCGREK